MRDGLAIRLSFLRGRTLRTAMIRLRVDYNNMFADDSVPINLDINSSVLQTQFYAGLHVILTDGDLEFEAILTYSSQYSQWLAHPIWSTRYDRTSFGMEPEE
jgi:hypothetical protein